MRRALVVSLAVLLLTSGALAAPASGARGTLDYVRVLDQGAGAYREGSITYLRVLGRGTVVLERSGGPATRFRVRQRLPAGRYRVTSFERPCEGMCLLLDPPVERCTRRVEIYPRGRTAVRSTVRPGRGCAMKVKARPVLFPPPARVRATRRYLAGRGASIGWALIDSHGRTHGLHPRRRYISASVVKAMLLVAYLRGLGNRLPDSSERALLGPMITVSDNDRASAVHGRVGDAGLTAVAARAGMKTFSPAGYWSGASFSALDQARFFRVFDRLVPSRSRGYARGLLSSIVAYQRWGFSRYSLAKGFDTFFKGGWLGTSRGSLVHEAAVFERGPLRVSMAVLSDANPSHDYGTETLRGVAQRIFGRPARGASVDELRRAGLTDVQSLAPGIGVELAYGGARNLTGRRLPGYCENRAMLLAPVARSLARAQRLLRRRGLGLLVLDAYRPARASRALVRWAERTGRADLVGTYIARRSRHNTGSAVDLTVVRASDGRRLPMGTGYDDLSSRAHTRNATGPALRRRLLLEGAMERFGFEGYWREWWHFEHRAQGGAYLDLPLGC